MDSQNLPRQLFDIQPTKENGDLNMEKIQRVKKVLDLRGKLTPKEKYQKEKAEEKICYRWKNIDNIIEEKQKISPKKYQEKHRTIEKYFQNDRIAMPVDKMNLDLLNRQNIGSKQRHKQTISLLNKINRAVHLKNIFYLNLTKGWKMSIFLFLSFSFTLFSIIGAMAFYQKTVQIKGKVLGISTVAYKHLELAQLAALNFQYAKSDLEFQSAYQNFLAAETCLSDIGRNFIKIAKHLPVSSTLSSGNYLLQAGKNLALAGQYINEGLADISKIKIMKPICRTDRNTNPSPIETLNQANKNFIRAKFYLKKTKDELNKVDKTDIPQNFQSSLVDFRTNLPIIIEYLDNFNKDAPTILKMLGEEHSQKYLLLFQNNHEMRATGGFIGTYGIIDINEGRIKNIFIDGIFNPDGQLKEKVVPPRPIQKISAAWSMHDANWFADFPTSAKKIAWFYEKTGGPTVDGVIAITPNVIEDLLKISGAIEMPEYKIIIDENNFREIIQYEVEVNYDKDLNRPKKILADLTPKLIDKIFNQEEIKLLDLLNVFNKNFQEKHILIYSFDPEIQSFISKKGWSGEILKTNKDYLSVINSNINGYKTDGVIDQKIQHRTEIQNDGSIIDVLTITRTHRGGNSPYDWYNKVNADYLRVFVPKGSELLEIKGHTREEYSLPMDYSNFLRDTDIQAIEKTLQEDESTGAHIFEESGKTVFGSWVYVSPGETVIVNYKYKLPFKFDFSRSIESYGLLVQKQAGSQKVNFRSSFNIPQGWKVTKPVCRTGRQVPSNNFCGSDICQISQTLETDQFYGVIFEKNKE